MIVDIAVPSGYPSVQDSLWSVAASDNSGQVNFKYVFDIYDNYTDKQLVRVKIFPDVNNGNGYFDAGSVVRNLVNYDWLAPADSIAVNVPDQYSEISVEYRTEIGEEYNVGASGITELNLASGVTKAYNFTPTVNDRNKLDLSTYIESYLTSRPLPTQITLRRDEPFYLGYFGDPGGGTSITYTVESDLGTYNGTSSSQSRFHQLNIGPAAAEAETGYVDNTVDTYDVIIGSKTITINIDDCEYQHPAYYLVFMNRFGMFDTARFACVSKKNMNVTRKAYETKEAKFNGMAVEYNTNNGTVYRWNESKINYAQSIDWNYKLTMDFPTDDEWKWLSELIYSPIVYLKDGNDYYPVTIKTSNYEEFRQIYAKLKTFEIEVERNTKLNGFRR